MPGEIALQTPVRGSIGKDGLPPTSPDASQLVDRSAPLPAATCHPESRNPCFLRRDTPHQSIACLHLKPPPPEKSALTPSPNWSNADCRLSRRG